MPDHNLRNSIQIERCEDLNGAETDETLVVDPKSSI